MTNCELCFTPGAKKTAWGEYLCNTCFNKRERLRDNQPAGIG